MRAISTATITLRLAPAFSLFLDLFGAVGMSLIGWRNASQMSWRLARALDRSGAWAPWYRPNALLEYWIHLLVAMRMVCVPW